MDTMVFDKGKSTYLVNTARLVRAQDEVADLADATTGDWAIDQSNPFLMWITGDFVEADRPNSNKQFWTAGDLAMAEYSIKYAPLNMVHKFRQPVGFYAATKTVDLTGGDLSSLHVDDEQFLTSPTIDWGKTPAGANAPYKIEKRSGKFAVINNAGTVKATFDSRTKALGYLRALYANVPGAAKRANKVKWTGKAKDRADRADDGGTLKIQALSGLWTHIFPFEAAQAEAANDEELLFYSMECRGTHLICGSDEAQNIEGCGEVFDYMDVQSHCEHLLERSSVRHIVNPTFRGGALIVPPVRPGWKNANASILEAAVMQEAAAYAEQNELAFNQLNAGGTDLSAAAWEKIMAMVLQSVQF